MTTTEQIKTLQTFETIERGTDAIFQVNDPVPFLAVHHWQIPLLLLTNLRIIGKLVEFGRD